MTLFQAIVAAFIGVFAEIFPLAPGAHQSLLEFFLGWNVSSPALQGTIELGIFLSLLFALRHDLLSHISSFLQIIIYRKRPRAMDEQMPLFVLIAIIAPIAAFFLFRRMPISPLEDPYLFAGIFGLSGLPLAFFDYYTKKNKSIYDWNVLDAALVGIGSAALSIPEIGRTTGAFTLASLRGFNREGAAKFILFIATPVLGVSAWYHLVGPGMTYTVTDFPKLYFYVVLAVSTLASSFAVHVYLNSMAKTPMLRYAIYRILIAGAVVGLHFYRSRL